MAREAQCDGRWWIEMPSSSNHSTAYGHRKRVGPEGCTIPKQLRGAGALSLSLGDAAVEITDANRMSQEEQEQGKLPGSNIARRCARCSCGSRDVCLDHGSRLRQTPSRHVVLKQVRRGNTRRGRQPGCDARLNARLCGVHEWRLGEEACDCQRPRVVSLHSQCMSWRI